MEKNKFLTFASVFLMLALVVTGCKSTPPAKAEPTPVASENSIKPTASVSVATVKPVDEALIALRNRMENARNECLKYKLDTYKQAEWAVAESSRAAGIQAYEVNYDLAKKSFEDAISQYEAIQKDSFNIVVAELDASILKAREDAIAVGANDYYPEQFALADTAAEEARQIRQNANLASSYDAGQKALLRYNFLLKGMQAVNLKRKIESNQFEQYGNEDFVLAGTKYDEASAAYGTADAAALESIVSSVVLYEKVNNAGFKVLTEGVIVKADDIRTLCQSIKAEKAMKTAYGDALKQYDSAATFGSDGNWEQAYTSYSAATLAFAVVFQEVTLKKNSAEAAITAAKNGQAKSTDLATKADILAPLPENAAGFSEETSRAPLDTTTEQIPDNTTSVQESVSGEEPK